MDAPHQDNVSSKAVVKFEEPSVKLLESYVKLDKHTDLNTSPSNWLKEHILGRFTDQLNESVSANKNGSFDFSSLLMAGRYPDMFDEVDVVSSSKHIKNILKTPFSLNSSYSMTVHRFGKSLFLNDFDVPLFLKSNRYKENDDLQWLNDLYCSADNISKDTEVYPKKRNKELSHLRLIESKFMHYSIDTETLTDSFSESGKRSPTRSNSICDAHENNASSNPPSPVKEPVTSTDKCPKGSYFMRDVLWTFEDITMLVGSDLPIFGGGKYPAVSLRLSDYTKPINILTGIDYWLDNLMCNVPEVMMCYHVDGIVQKYEKIKTAELPSLQGSQFSPNRVKDVAQNILSFLKSNCTQEGHTYWLFKSKKDDVVKLYDLTSISLNSNSVDPFSSSVAFLLYKIAYNMYIATSNSERNIPKIITILHNCINLLDCEKSPEILLMASYILSDLYCHSITGKENGSTSSSSNDGNVSDNDSSCATTDDDDDDDVSESEQSIQVSDLGVPNNPMVHKSKKRHLEENISQNLNVEEKCKRAITAVIEGLDILLNRTDQNNSSINRIEEAVQPLVTPLQCSESVVLALPYTVGGNQCVKPFSSSAMVSNLFEKAAQSYLSLVMVSLAKEKLGRALRLLQIAFNCMANVTEMTIVKSVSMKALMYYGDILTMFASKRDFLNLDSEQEEFLNFTEDNRRMKSFFFRISTKEEVKCFNMNVGNIGKSFDLNYEELVTCALDVYEECLDNVEKENEDNVEEVEVILEVTRRLGNIKNELGVLYLNKATNTASEFGVPTDAEQSLWKKSFMYFEEGIKTFEFTNDTTNMALLYSNTGKLMRLCAKVYGNSTKSSADGSRAQFTLQEQTYFNKAFEYYQKALSLVQTTKQEVSTGIADNVSMELSGAYFSMASLMQDYAPLNSMAEENVIKQIASALMKALKYVENVSSSNVEREKAVTSQVGAIHHKLASLYHHVLRNQISDHVKKNYRSLAELHYNKVYESLYPADLFPIRNLKCVIEHLAFHDHQLKQQTHFSLKTLKSKHELLFHNKHLYNVITALRNSGSGPKFDSCAEIDGTPADEVSKLLGWLYGQFSSTLKDSVKALNARQNTGICKIDLKAAKLMFEVVIRAPVFKLTTVSEKLNSMQEMLEKLRKIYKGK